MIPPDIAGFGILAILAILGLGKTLRQPKR
jgi:hypothetical protein